MIAFVCFQQFALNRPAEMAFNHRGGQVDQTAHRWILWHYVIFRTLQCRTPCYKGGLHAKKHSGTKQ